MISVKYVPIKERRGEILTKVLTDAEFTRHRGSLMNLHT